MSSRGNFASSNLECPSPSLPSLLPFPRSYNTSTANRNFKQISDSLLQKDISLKSRATASYLDSNDRRMSSSRWQTLTPEAKLPRSDSRLASTTCRGICVNGRPCRRSLGSSKSALKRSSESVAFGSISHLYCWQHQDQSNAAPPSTPLQKSQSRISVRRKSSIDSLVDRLGIVDIAGDNQLKHSHGGVRRRHESEAKKIRPRPGKPPSKGHASSFLAFLCCGGSSEDDYYEVVRHRQRVQRQEEPQMSMAKSPMPSNMRYAGPTRASWIPGSIHPRTAALLQLELSKPISKDDEAGYIYMFWITEEARPPVYKVLENMPPVEETRGQPTGGKPDRFPARRIFDEQKSLRVKIGRATNVHRRLSSWSRQCGYQLSLLRFYPHVLGASWAGDDARRTQEHLRMVPYCHRVERLIHLELEAQRVAGVQCKQCGKVHREWFEVDATSEGLRAIDSVIRRWVNWAEIEATKVAAAP